MTDQQDYARTMVLGGLKGLTTLQLLRNAELTQQGNRVWAAQDLPLQKRTRKIFLMSLKWQLAEWGLLKREFEVDDEFTQLKVGHLVVSKYPWRERKCNAPGRIPELQQSELARANASLQKNVAAKGTGKSRSAEVAVASS